MATDSFSVLPVLQRDSFLQQSFQQLDQRHLFGVVPMVCRLWHQLSLSIITSLDANLPTQEAAEQLRLWIQNHGPALRSMQLLIGEPAASFPSLLLSISADQWHSMHHECRSYSTVVDFALPPLKGGKLPGLTRLSIIRCCPGAAVLASVLSLRGLSSLSLCDLPHDLPWGPFMEQLATRLVGLMSLDLSDTYSWLQKFWPEHKAGV